MIELREGDLYDSFIGHNCAGRCECEQCEHYRKVLRRASLENMVNETQRVSNELVNRRLTVKGRLIRMLLRSNRPALRRLGDWLLQRSLDRLGGR